MLGSENDWQCGTGFFGVVFNARSLSLSLLVIRTQSSVWPPVPLIYLVYRLLLRRGVFYIYICISLKPQTKDVATLTARWCAVVGWCRDGLGSTRLCLHQYRSLPLHIYAWGERLKIKYVRVQLVVYTQAGLDVKIFSVQIAINRKCLLALQWRFNGLHLVATARPVVIDA